MLNGFTQMREENVLLPSWQQGVSELKARHFIKGSLLLPRRDWEMGLLSSLLITFQRRDSRSLRKAVRVCKTGKKLLLLLLFCFVLFYKVYISKRQRENCKFKSSKVNALREGRSGLSERRGEACLKFGRAEGSFKAVLVSSFYSC